MICSDKLFVNVYVFGWNSEKLESKSTQIIRDLSAIISYWAVK